MRAMPSVVVVMPAAVAMSQFLSELSVRRLPYLKDHVVQGSIVVLHNRDGRILAEAGGRRVFNGRSASYSDYNRVTKSLRQPGSAPTYGSRNSVADQRSY